MQWSGILDAFILWLYHLKHLAYVFSKSVEEIAGHLVNLKCFPYHFSSQYIVQTYLAMPAYLQWDYEYQVSND